MTALHSPRWHSYKGKNTLRRWVFAAGKPEHLKFSLGKRGGTYCCLIVTTAAAVLYKELGSETWTFAKQCEAFTA